MRRPSGRVTAALALGLLVGLAVAPPAHADDAELTVMSRNLYLGADVSVALDLLPDMPAAAQFMWDQVAATDFSARAPKLAAELARERPDVVALQEATQWLCRPSALGSSTVVFDFTEQLLRATEAAGVPYVLATHDGVRAMNPGYRIPALPSLTTVRDPETFQPLFGTDSAACGFTIGDALLVRADRAQDVTGVGIGDYDAHYTVVPVLFEVDRGYAWADLRVGQGSTVRVVATHLESAWDPGAPPASAAQAAELVAATAHWRMPLVVIGDFNADPRDPRPADDPNPGLQPDVTTGCAAQVDAPTAATARPECNAYWVMRAAGFADAGPDALAAENRTWGASALLAGPDPARLAAAGANRAGFTDRLDYVFTRNGASVVSAGLVGAEWPGGQDLWDCRDPRQLANAQEVARALGATIDGPACLPTDHAGLVVTVAVAPGDAGEAAVVDDRSALLLGALVLLLGAGAAVLWRRSRSSSTTAAG